MPIWDSQLSGTTGQIGAIWDRSATEVYHQIGNVWDSNTAGVLSLVYTAETQIYPGTSVSTYDNATMGSHSVGTFYGSGSGTSGGTQRAFITVDLTPYKTLRVTYSFIVGSYSFIFLGICNGWRDNPYDMSINGNIIQQWQLYTGSAGTGDNQSRTYTYDVSGINGTYYVGGEVYNGSTASTTTAFSITSIVGE